MTYNPFANPKAEAKKASPFAIVNREGFAIRPADIQFRNFRVRVTFDRKKESGVMTTLRACSRCGGQGGWKGWPGFTCYRCAGDGIDPKGNEVKLYTRRKQEKLEATRVKRAAAKAAKDEAKRQATLERLRQDELFTRIEALRESEFYNYGGFICDVFFKWVKYNTISAAQREALERSVTREEEWVASKVAEADSKKPAPTGKVEIQGEIVKFKTVDGYAYSSVLKMLVKCDGFKVWGTVPKSLMDAEKGDTVKFTATVERSSDDESFAFFKRPTKASVVQA